MHCTFEIVSIKEQIELDFSPSQQPYMSCCIHTCAAILTSIIAGMQYYSFHPWLMLYTANIADITLTLKPIRQTIQLVGIFTDLYITACCGSIDLLCCNSDNSCKMLRLFCDLWLEPKYYILVLSQTWQLAICLYQQYPWYIWGFSL